MNKKPQHPETPTPWREGKTGGTVVADSAVGLTLMGATDPDAFEYYGGNLIAESVSPANARRIVACVNAMKDFTTEQLEKYGPLFIKVAEGVLLCTVVLEEIAEMPMGVIVDRDLAAKRDAIFARANKALQLLTEAGAVG